MYLLYSIFSEFYSSISWCYYPGLHKVQNYLHRKVQKKRRVETHSKIIKLIHCYTQIILSSYANFRSDRTIIHKDKSILLLDHYLGLILFIGIAAKCNEPKTIWIQTGPGQLPSQGHVDSLFIQRNRHQVNSLAWQGFWDPHNCDVFHSTSICRKVLLIYFFFLQRRKAILLLTNNYLSRQF